MGKIWQFYCEKFLFFNAGNKQWQSSLFWVIVSVGIIHSKVIIPNKKERLQVFPKGVLFLWDFFHSPN